MVAGEITTKATLDVPKLAREVIADIGFTDAKMGFDAKTCGILNVIQTQSPDIAMGVDTGGAGDQGLMFGYACDETAELMPLPILMAHHLVKQLSDIRRTGKLTYLRPDGKSQVSVEYVDGQPKRIDAVVISTQHDDDVTTEQLRADVKKYIIDPIVPVEHGGFGHQVSHQPDRPVRDRRTSRRHRPDRAQDHRRHLRRHGPSRRRGLLRQGSDEGGPLGLLHGALRREEHRRGRVWPSACEVQLAYAIGVAEPVSVMVNTFGTGTIPEERLVELVRANFQLTPKGMIDTLKLRRPIYRKTAAFGHFGRTEDTFSWEATDKAHALKEAAQPAGCGPQLS